MKIQNHSHLSYCTNIHSGESWKDVFFNLKKHTTKIRDHFGTEKPFGIGLRLSASAAATLLESHHLLGFKNWLSQENMYVFTMNGFPYGAFHHTAVKDHVHTPDWTTDARLTYTRNLFDILAELLPDKAEGSISTSPLSYKYWHDNEVVLEEVKQKSCHNLIAIVCHLFNIREKTGQHLHLDIEPEPDGIIETSNEWVAFFQDYLLSEGVSLLAIRLGITPGQAEMAIRSHLQLCYDICHFAIGFEDPHAIISTMEKQGIGIGKIQISAALSTNIFSNSQKNTVICQHLSHFDEPVYLHQTVYKDSRGNLTRFKDLKPAMKAINDGQYVALRTHFHVPVFTKTYNVLQATQEDIIETLELWKTKPFTKHMEVETYTWDILPEMLKTDIDTSICRELEWVIKILKA